MNFSTITLLFKVIPGYMFRLDLVILRPILTFVLPDTRVYTVSGNTNVNIGLRMTKSSRNM